MDLSIDRHSLWLQRYFDVWVSNDPAAVSSLFSADAVYHSGPFREHARRREAIVLNWTASPGQPSAVVCHFEPLAVDGSLVLRCNFHFKCEEHRERYSYRERDR